MAAAAELLSQRAIPVRKVAQQVGNRQASHFAQAFRCRYGVSPTGFRTASLEQLITVEFVNERADLALYLVPGRADLGKRTALRVGKLPIDVALAGNVWAGIAAAHRHDYIRLLGKLLGEELGAAVG